MPLGLACALSGYCPRSQKRPTGLYRHPSKRIGPRLPMRGPVPRLKLKLNSMRPGIRGSCGQTLRVDRLAICGA